MSVSSKDKAEFYFHMGRHTKATPAQCERLLRYAATLQRLATEQCNRVWTERDENKRVRIRMKVLAVCEEINTSMKIPKISVVSRVMRVHPVFSNDPRGACLKIAVPDGFYTDWGKEGIICPA